MPRPKPRPELVSLAVEAVRGGASSAEVAEQIGVTTRTIDRWVEAAPPVPPPPEDPPPEGESDDALDSARAMRRDFLSKARNAQKAGHYDAAVSASKQAGEMLKLIARLEKSQRETGDALRFSKADIDAAIASVQTKLAAYMARPLLCAGCGRQLSADLGGYDRNVATTGVVFPNGSR